MHSQGVPRLSGSGRLICNFARRKTGMVPLPSHVPRHAAAKIIENRHTFVRFRYIREDGLPAQYIPDFFVRFGNDVYIVETKAQDQVSHNNVVRKQKSALRWVERINSLPLDKREGLTWHYAVLGDAIFYDWRNKRMSILDMLEFAELRNDEVAGWTGRMF